MCPRRAAEDDRAGLWFYRQHLKHRRSSWLERQGAVSRRQHTTEQAGDPTAALPEYAKLLDGSKLDLWTVRSRFQSGSCYAKLKQTDQAVIEFVKVEISYPQYPKWQAQSILEIGRILLSQKKPEQAAEQFKNVIQRFEKEEAAAEARKLLAGAAPTPSN